MLAKTSDVWGDFRPGKTVQCTDRSPRGAVQIQIAEWQCTRRTAGVKQ